MEASRPGSPSPLLTPPIAAAALVAALLWSCSTTSPPSDAAAAADGHADTTTNLDATASRPFVGTIRGRVLGGGAPLAGAIVRFGGRAEQVTSGADGSFALEVKAPPVDLNQLALAAARLGYYTGGVQIGDAADPVELDLDPLPAQDNPAYVYIEPDGPDVTPRCIHCHVNQLDPWSQSAHATAANNPVLHDLYNGTASGLDSEAACLAAGGAWRAGRKLGGGSANKCYLPEGGVLAALNPGICGGVGQPTCDDPTAPASATPSKTGACADCHAPANVDHQPGATNLNTVAGLAFDKGIHCDFCHKIRAVIVNDRPGLDGALELLRPGNDGRPGLGTSFGPLTDVTAYIMGDSYQPQYARSEYCSGCHQWAARSLRPGDAIDAQKWPDGLPIYDTYFEWSQGAHGRQCQQCHMPAMEAENASTDFKGLDPWPSGTLGWPRAYGQIRDHRMAARWPQAPAGYLEAAGDAPRALLREPLKIQIVGQKVGAELRVEVKLTNAGAGHSIPSGSPARQLIMLVEASAGGALLAAIGGTSLPAWGGARLQGRLAPGESTLVGSTLTLPSGLEWPAAAVGKRLRFVEPTGSYDDYPATRWFGDPARSAQQKGLEIARPLAEVAIGAVNGAVATLETAPTLPPGAHFFLGDPLATAAAQVDDAIDLLALAGAPGQVFAKVMVDESGTRSVPFYRAVDIAVDNRIPSGETATTQHVFDAGSASGNASVTVTLLHRPQPWSRAAARGWTTRDLVRARQSAQVSLGN